MPNEHVSTPVTAGYVRKERYPSSRSSITGNDGIPRSDTNTNLVFFSFTPVNARTIK